MTFSRVRRHCPPMIRISCEDGPLGTGFLGFLDAAWRAALSFDARLDGDKGIGCKCKGHRVQRSANGSIKIDTLFGTPAKKPA
jgi:hypothetical protein